MTMDCLNKPLSKPLNATPSAPAEAGPFAVAPVAAAPAKTLPRISSRHLLRDRRVIEIDHEGRIYQLRVTQLNKLILTA